MLTRAVGALAVVTILLGFGVAVLRSDRVGDAAHAHDTIVDIRGVVGAGPGGVLAALATADTDVLQAVALTGEDVLLATLDEGPDAAAVADWWRSLPQHRRATLVDLLPGVVGNLDGVPYAVRDTANRRHLTRLISDTEERIASALGRAEMAELRATASMLAEVFHAAAPDEVVPRQLISLDARGAGRAAVSLGDLDTATHVAMLVPGMFFTVQGQIVDWTEIALGLHSEAVSVGGDHPDELTIATIAWMGYQTPDVFTVTALDRAHEGATHMARTVAGLQSSRHHTPHTTLIAHSYGSTAAAIALSHGDMSVDALVMVGSPGVGADTVASLGLDSGSVFVIEAQGDPVAGIGLHGTDPASPEFGATVIDSHTGTDASGAPLEPAVGHLGYFSAGTTALRDLALVGAGRGADLGGTV